MRPNSWMDEAGTWHGGRLQPRRLCVRWRPSPFPPKKARSPPPQFSAHFYCGQTARCIKMPLGMELGLCPGDFVLDGDPAPAYRFSNHIYCGQTAAWIKMPLGTGLALGPDDTVLDGDPAAPPSKRGRSPLPNFRPTSIMAKRLDRSRWHLARRWALVQATLC